MKGKIKKWKLQIQKLKPILKGSKKELRSEIEHYERLSKYAREVLELED